MTPDSGTKRDYRPPPRRWKRGSGVGQSGREGGAQNARLQPRLIPLLPAKIPEVRAARGRGRIRGTCRGRPGPRSPRRAPAGHREASERLGSRFRLNSPGARLGRRAVEEGPDLKEAEDLPERGAARCLRV